MNGRIYFIVLFFSPLVSMYFESSGLVLVRKERKGEERREENNVHCDTNRNYKNYDIHIDNEDDRNSNGNGYDDSGDPISM